MKTAKNERFEQGCVLTDESSENFKKEVFLPIDIVACDVRPLVISNRRSLVVLPPSLSVHRRWFVAI
jgi:hypothetical protein